MRKFKIPTIPHTTPKCIRFPDDLIEKIEEAIEGKNCTFTAFVLESVRLALNSLDEK
jgi:hypothetical protein